MVRPSLQSPAPVLKKRGILMSAGFSLIEMLVVIGIIVIITGIVLANNARFGGVVQLQNLAYDIALSIRQAQVYGISVQRFKTTGTFAPAYGMHFESTDKSNYYLFGDVNDPLDGVYNATCDCELVQSTKLQSGYTIEYLFVTPVSGSETATGTVTAIDITYRRPDPDAYITMNGQALSFDANGRYLSGNLNEQARIVVKSPRGDLKSIIVYINGQISTR